MHHDQYAMQQDHYAMQQDQSTMPEDQCAEPMYQMNPTNLVHMNKIGSRKANDVRGSNIAIYIRRDEKADTTEVLVISLLDDRFKHIVRSPIERVGNARLFKNCQSQSLIGFSVLLTYLDVVLDWWNDVLYYFNEQLIDQVCPEFRIVELRG